LNGLGSEMGNKQRIRTFKNFVEKQILPAVNELTGLADARRVHLQKLVYTNLADRFDTLIDDLIKINGRQDSLLTQALKPFDQPMKESDLILLLMDAENLDSVFDAKIEEGLRNTVLRQRHSKKLRILFETVNPEEELRAPRVNRNTGNISDTEKIHDKKIPHGVLGFSDYLYSRRNSLVHGAGKSQFLKNDLLQMKKLYKVDMNKRFRISSNSVAVSAKFYSCIADILAN